MKNPHDKSEYEKLPDSGDEQPAQSSSAEQPVAESDEQPSESKKAKKKRAKYSGAYYYVDTDEQKLAEYSFIRTTLTIIAFMLQLVVLALPQGGLEYVTNTIQSYSFVYMWVVFVMIGVSVWLIIMNKVRYKFQKRIPKENAPKNGFKRRAFFGAELYIAMNALMLAFELSFVCIHYDGVGLGAMFICVAALAAAIAARQVTNFALKNAELVPAPDEQQDENKE